MLVTEFVRRLTLASSVLAPIATLDLTVLTDLEHSRSTQPSAVVQGFLFATILLDAVRLRTQWLLQSNFTIASVFTVTFVLKVILLVLEPAQKWQRSTIPAEETTP